MKNLLIALVAVSLCGCNADGDDGVDEKAVQDAQAPLISAARNAGGDWNKLSEADRKLFLDRARGNEKAAQQMVGFMAGAAPPTNRPQR